MELGQAVQSLRQAKIEQREAAVQAAEKHAPARYAWWQKWIWCAVEILRYAWLNVYPLAALVAGVVFVFYVKQAREILGDLPNEWLTLGVLAVWAASIWYSMRVLSSTDFPGDAEPHEAAKAIMPWLIGQSPRVVAFAGLVLIACASSIFLTEKPGPHWIAPLAAGVVPVTWAAQWLGDRIVGLWLPTPPARVYRWSTLLTALAAAAIASYSWSTVPQPMRTEPVGLHLEDGLLGVTIVLTLVSLAVRRTGALAEWSMAGAFAVWLWIVHETAQSHPGGPKLPFMILALAALGLWFTLRRREIFSIRQKAAKPEVEVGLSTFVALGIALCLQLVLVIALTFSPIAIGMGIGTLGILFLGLALLACFGIVWVFLPKYVTVPSLALVPVVWYLALGNMPDHTLRATSFAAPPPRPRLVDHFKEWREQLPDRDASPIFFVTAAGGGLRAAYWTATMLAIADDRTCGEFGRHVYAYSGVSGGSLGIAAYLAQRQVWQAKPRAERCQPGRHAEIVKLLNRDFLAPLAGSLLFAEMAQRFVPFDYLDDDRGSVLAKAWSGAWDEVFPENPGRFDRPFLEVFGEKGGPVVMLNATSVDSGRRAIASNIQVRLPDGIDLFRPVRDVGALRTNGLTLREAVLNSARFAYVSPAATVHGCAKPNPDGSCAVEPKVWDLLVDGGYFENSGVATMSDLVRALAVARERALAEKKADPGPRKDQLFFIVIDNSNESPLACRERNPVPLLGGDGNEDLSPPDVAPISGLAAPIQALLHVREARGQLEVRRLALDFSCRDARLVDWHLFGDQKNRTLAQAAGQEPALGWLLSRRSAKWIGERATDVAGQFPFRHAACHTGKLPTEQVKTVVGERTQPNVPCGP